MKHYDLSLFINTIYSTDKNLLNNFIKAYIEKNGIISKNQDSKNVFSNYHILGTGADKDSALAEFHDTGLYWVEDKPTNALAGLRYGLKPILIDHPYNRDFNHPDGIRVNNWKQIHEILSK